MKTTSRYVWAAFASVAITISSYASVTDGPYANAGDVRWIAPPENYSGAAFAEAFRYKTLVGGQNSPIQGKNVFFGEAEFAPGAVYVGHKHPSPEIYYVISGEAEWTVDGKTFDSGNCNLCQTQCRSSHGKCRRGSP